VSFIKSTFLSKVQSYIKGDGLSAIQARVKLQILLSMTESEIIKSFAKFKETNKC